MGWSLINPSVYISGTSTNVTIKNLIIKNSPESGISSLITSNRIFINNVTVTKAGNNGIWIRSPNSVVKNSKSFENGREPGDTGDRAGIGIGNCGGTNITVEGNEVYKNGQDDQNSDFEISVYGITGQVYVRRNYVHDCGSGCIQISTTGSPTDASGSEIFYNVIDGYGTTTYSGETNTGKYSGIRIGSPAGSADDNVKNVKIYNNIISGGGAAARDNEGAGIAITKEGTDGAIIKNNIFYNNLGAEILLLQTSGYNINNNLYSATSKWNLDYSVKTTFSSWKSSTSQDSNSKQGDPLFINYATKDFHLNSGSPAIDSGINVGLTNDFEGITISGTPDIGAFESTGRVGILEQIMQWLGNAIKSFSNV